MKNLIKEIVKAINKEVRRLKKIKTEQYHQIVELAENFNYVSKQLEIYKKKLRYLQRENIELKKEVKQWKRDYQEH